MPEHELTQILKLWYCVVCKTCCLIAFFALDADSNMGSLNHVNIIGPITDSHRNK